MTKLALHSTLDLGCVRRIAFVLPLVCALITIPVPLAQAQTYNVIFDFSLQSGWQPYAGVTRDAAGNLFGTTTAGGIYAGTVFELKRSHGGWTLNTLFTFNPLMSDGPVGYNPWSGVVFGPDGALYGTTTGGGVGGGSNGYGVVYRLVPPATACMTVLCPWAQTVLYEFMGGNDGSFPALGNVTFDEAGNLYGTTGGGGDAGSGVVYELTPSNENWTEKVLHSFSGGTDGSEPYSAVVFDQAGNLYGTTYGGGGSGCGGHGCGTIYELSPSGSGWTETILYAFQGTTDGQHPIGGLISDQSGNLYGGTNQGGSAGGGTVFELSPSGGNWNFSLLYSLGPDLYGLGGPEGNLAMDATGSLYGTTTGDGANGTGSVFKLTPRNDGWTYTLLYSFDGGLGIPSGYEPIGGPIVDAMGNIYGTASEGGTQSCEFEINCGTVWTVTP
jgi:uncharacterized repeat protein (TIGR03803 family)